jgi:CubicO group peptidase (beta-lactamase class C family)
VAVCGKIDRRSHDQSLAGPGDRGAGPRPLAGDLRAGHSAPPYGAAPLIPALCLAVALAATGPPAATAGAPADTTRLGRLATYVDRLEAFGFSGQILVAEHGQVVIDRASGWADRRFAVPMSPETRLGIGSVTKNFVAAAVLRLASRHRLKVTDRLGDRLPGVPADKADIRLDQILEHTAGFHRDIPDGLDQATRDEVVSAVLSSPLAYLPGADFQYSNAGYDLLAAVVGHELRRIPAARAADARRAHRERHRRGAGSPRRAGRDRLRRMEGSRGVARLAARVVGHRLGAHGLHRARAVAVGRGAAQRAHART